MQLVRIFKAFSDQPVIRELRGVMLFMAITLGFHYLYKLSAGQFNSLQSYIIIAEFLRDKVYFIVAWINELIFFESMTRVDEIRNLRFSVSHDGGHLVREMSINLGCSGMKQLLQTLVLFLLYPGKIKHKFWYIPMAMLIIQMANIARILFLSAVMLYLFPYWDFLHDWVARPFIYLVLFVLWILWDKYFTPERKAGLQPDYMVKPGKD